MIFFIYRRSAQFVDLLGYFSVSATRPPTDSSATAGGSGGEPLMAEYATRAVAMLRAQNRILAGHANSALYTALAQLVDFGGFFLESDPCLVCNNPEVPFATLKLANLKVDTKFTTREVSTTLNLLYTVEVR
jgi:E3 ubiquitin-protein ligase UBR4